MALTRITKGVIKPNENYDTHNINSTGIVTAIGLDVNGSGDISGNLNVGGVLTYEDVTSIDSVGIITAQSDIHVGGGVSAVGVGTFGGLDINGDIDVDGHTNLDNVSVAGVTTFASSIHVADSIIHEGDTDTKIDFVNNVVKITAGNKLRIDSGTSNYTTIYGSTNFTPTSSLPKASGGYVARFRDEEGDDTIVRFHNTNVKNTVLQWSDYGSSSSAGNLVFQGFVNGVEGGRFDGSGNFKLNKDLDVDGHTNLDNVSIAGFTTFAQNINVTGSVTGTSLVLNAGSPTIFLNDTDANSDFSIQCNGGLLKFMDTTNSYAVRLSINSSGNVSIAKDLDVDGHTNLDNVSVAGITTFSNATTIVNGGYHRGIINSGAQAKIIGGYISGSDTLRLGESMYLTSTGLGINESSPPQRLTVGGDIQIGFNTPNDAGRQLNFNVNRGSAEQTLANINWQWNSKFVAQIRGIAGSDTTNKDDAHLAFFTSSANNLSERLRITSAGKIEVKGTRAGSLQASDDDTLQLYTKSTNNSIDRGTGITFYNHDNSGYEMGGTIQVAKENGTADDVAAYMRFSTRPAGGSATEKLRITSGGNVAINKTSGISAKLHIGDSSNNGALSQLIKLGNDSSGAGTGAQINMGAAHGNESTAACIGGFLDSAGGTSFIVKTAGTYANQSTVGERLRITSGGHTIPGANTTYDLGANVNNRWRNIYGQTLSLTSYATVGSIVAADPGSAYYAYNNRIGGGLAVAGTTRLFGSVGIGTGTTDGLLTIKGNSDATTTPSIRLLDGTDTREVSITNTSGDFIASTHGTDNVAHGSIKVYDSGIIALSTNSGGGNAERLRVDLNGSVRHMGTAGYWQITVIHNGSGSGNWYSGSAPQRIYPNYIDNRTGYAEFYLTFHPSTSYSGYGEPTFIITGESYLKTGGTIELNYNGRTNSPNNGTFRCYHGEYSWQIYNDGDTDQVSGQREINRNVEHRSTSYVASSTQSVDYVPSNDGRYGTNVEPIIDQRSYIKIKMNGVGSHNAIQNHDVFVKFTTYTQGDKTWQAYMQYN